VKLREYPLLVDENIHPDVVVALRAAGRDVVSVRESQLIGSDDRTLLRLAKAQGRIVLTHDSDFGTLAIAERESFVGIA
jgi:predicted nuclease of predicted toxin-antitoxin system